jgi:hypothetical protein
MIPKTQEEQAKFSIGKETEGKRQSQSKRLRNVVYLLHKQLVIKPPFDEYYETYMESTISGAKSQLKSSENKEA